ncbi:MAG: hypothetical protein HN348_08170 [Proteobacteria bacterium]|nr:hypothetical protein [Pseudomonadota bacterium]
MDLRTPTAGYTAEGTYTETFTYNVETSIEPRARAVDDYGGVGDWDAYDCLLTDINLDTVLEVPIAEMQCWSPNAGGPDCTGSPDGEPQTTFLLAATYTDPDAALGGRVVEVQWDFDGNGTADWTEAVSDVIGAGTASVFHSYGVEGSFVPWVRFIDNDGGMGN